MTIEGLGFITNCFEQLGIPYEFMEWTQELSVPFFVGEYTEIESLNEDGFEEDTFILTGTTTNKYMELESVKDEIKQFFGYEGVTAILESGSGIAVSYVTSFPIPTDENEMHRIQINLNVKEWRC
jgi:hypothetical protein